MEPIFELPARETRAATVVATRSKLFSSRISLELHIWSWNKTMYDLTGLDKQKFSA